MQGHEEYMKRIKHDIRNTRGLNAGQLAYVMNLEKAEKDEVIQLMNEILQTCHAYIMEFVR